MSLVLTQNAIIVCGHGGQLQFTPGSLRLMASGGEVLTQLMLQSATISGCTNSGESRTPCTAVASIVAGQSIKLTGPDGSPAMLNTMQILTNGSHPNLSTVSNPGQTKLDSV